MKDSNDFVLNVRSVRVAKRAKSTNVSVANSIFIKATDEDEIIGIVTSFKFKRSMDDDGFDMDLVKDITGYKVKTFTCSLSLKRFIPWKGDNVKGCADI